MTSSLRSRVIRVSPALRRLPLLAVRLLLLRLRRLSFPPRTALTTTSRSCMLTVMATEPQIRPLLLVPGRVPPPSARARVSWRRVPRTLLAQPLKAPALRRQIALRALLRRPRGPSFLVERWSQCDAIATALLHPQRPLLLRRLIRRVTSKGMLRPLPRWLCQRQSRGPFAPR